MGEPAEPRDLPANWKHVPDDGQPYIKAEHWATSVKYPSTAEIIMLIKTGKKDWGEANQQRIAVLNHRPDNPRPIRATTAAPSAETDRITIDYVPQNRPHTEPRGAEPATAGITNADQGGLSPENLTKEYTYIGLNMGKIFIATSTPGKYMRTFYEHHITVAYLAATNEQWKQKAGARFFDMLEK